jgi:hypothetical protein
MPEKSNKKNCCKAMNLKNYCKAIRTIANKKNTPELREITIVKFPKNF